MTCVHGDCQRPAEEGRDECFHHRVSTVGFKFVGGGGYTRQSFHDRTVGEFLREHVGGSEKELAKRSDIEKVST